MERYIKTYYVPSFDKIHKFTNKLVALKYLRTHDLDRSSLYIHKQPAPPVGFMFPSR